jgi:predicted transcriptional regulator
MTEEKILIDRDTLKAIASDTRLDILKSLSKRKKTLSELSKVLNLKSPTIKEHLDHIINSNLVLK